MKKKMQWLVFVVLAALLALIWRDAQAAKQPVVVGYPTPPGEIILSAPTPGAEWWVTPAGTAGEAARSAALYAVEPTAPPQKGADKEAHELVSKAELMVRGLVDNMKEVTGKDSNK